MSSASSEMSVPMLNCGLCKSMYRQPKILSCLHSFCQPCLQQMPIHCDHQRQPLLRCPRCSRETPLPQGGVSDLVTNDFLTRMCQEYVSEVQRTLGTGKAFSSGGSSPGQGPASPSSVVGGRSLTGSGQLGSFQENVTARSRFPGVQSPSATSPSQSTAFTYDVQRSSAPYSSLSSTSSDSYQQTERRPSLEMLPLRARQRRFSVTPPEVLRIWEGLQRKLNGLQSASVQITYGLENINMTESNWYQRKQDLRREVQRRSAQLQFFIKRQERLLLAMLDSKDTDDAFIKASDQARDDLRANLKSVVHESEVVKSVLDLAIDSELLTLGGHLLGSNVSQQDVSMAIPELHFKIPEELSVEDKMGEDFGSFTSTTVTREIYKPEIIEQDLPEVEVVQQDMPEEEEKETVVTETVMTYVPSGSEELTASVSDTHDQLNAMDPVPENKEEEKGEEEEEEEEEEDEEEDEEKKEEEEEEEEVIVEETIEIIDGKMHVISSRRVVNPKPKKEPPPQPVKKEKKRKPKKREDKKTETKPQEPAVSVSRGRDPHAKRTVNSSPASVGRTEQTAALASVSTATSTSQISGSVSGLQTLPATSITLTQPKALGTQGPEPNRPQSGISLTQPKPLGGRGSETSRPTTLNIATSSHSSHGQVHDVPQTERERLERSRDENSPGDRRPKTPSDEHQSTLNKFQSFRESLKQRRRDLLGASIGPAHLGGMSSFLPREKRVQSLDRRSSLRELVYRPPSPPESSQRQEAEGATATFSHTSTHPGEGEDSTQGSLTSTDNAQTSATSGASKASPLSPTEKTSRPVRRAVSAASDKATKMEFLRETWKKRKELLIQNDAYITSTDSKEDEEDAQGQDTGAVAASSSSSSSSLDDGHRSSRAPQKARSRITDMSEALTGSSAERGMEPVLPHSPLEGGAYGSTVTAESPAEAQALHTVDKILQKKNVPILSPRSPRPTPPSTSPTTTATTTTTFPWPSKPSMVVRPRPRDPATDVATTTTTTSASSAPIFVPTPLETLQEDETKSPAAQGQSRGLRTTSPTRGDSLQQVRASIRRKKERWRSLSLT